MKHKRRPFWSQAQTFPWHQNVPMPRTCRNKLEKPHKRLPICSSWKRAGRSKDITKAVKEMYYMKSLQEPGKLTSSPGDLTRSGAGGKFLVGLTSGSNFTLSMQARCVILSAMRLGIISRTVRAWNSKLRLISSVSEERWILLLPFIDAQGTGFFHCTAYWLVTYCGKNPLPNMPLGQKGV